MLLAKYMVLFFNKKLDKILKNEILNIVHEFMKQNFLFQKKYPNAEEQYGYTIIEILLIALIIGLTLSVYLPLFGAVLNKVKQREGTLIVNGILKTVKANYALASFLPTKMKNLNKFALFQKCISEEVAIKGSKVCTSKTIVKTDAADNFFYSPSGNYKIELKTSKFPAGVYFFCTRFEPDFILSLDKSGTFKYPTQVN